MLNYSTDGGAKKGIVCFFLMDFFALGRPADTPVKDIDSQGCMTVELSVISVET